MEIEKARLIKKEEVSAGLFIFDLESKAVSRKALPGQFVQIRVWDSFDPFLRRPFSIAQVDSDTFRIAFRIRGKGTKILALTREDDYLDVLGPLGKPIPAYEDRNIVLIGGGVGIAPLLFLAQKLAVKNRLFIFLGARSRNELLFLPDFKQLTNHISYITEDGSFGKIGLVTDLLTTLPTNPLVFTCGPIAMLKALQKTLTPITVYGFLEKRLGCGTGLCFGCAVKKRAGGYLRVCKDGPVLNLNEIEI